MKKVKLKLSSDKNLRCPNCKHFKLYLEQYATKYDCFIGCSNCNVMFVATDIDSINLLKEYHRGKKLNNK